MSVAIGIRIKVEFVAIAKLYTTFETNEQFYNFFTYELQKDKVAT